MGTNKDCSTNMKRGPTKSIKDHGQSYTQDFALTPGTNGCSYPAPVAKHTNDKSKEKAANGYKIV